jgi:transketolase
MKRQGPVAIALTRQKIPVMDLEKELVLEGVSRGAYIVAETDDLPDLILIATGSEVQLILEVSKRLQVEGIKARAISMPSWELFEEQSEEYRHSVLPPEIPTLAVEAGATLGWHKYVGNRGAIIGIDRFGASAPGDEVMRRFGFAVERIIEQSRSLLAQKRKSGVKKGRK